MESGLEDVVAAETVLSDVDGLGGRLIIRGASLDDLSGQRFEAVAAMLLDGFFDPPINAAAVAAELGRARERVFAHTRSIDSVLLALAPTEAVRALLARLPDGDDVAMAMNLLAAPAVFAPAFIRARQGRSPIAPEASLGHSADVLRMLTGQPAHATAAAALDTYLVTVIDHGLNASTFAARVVASTKAGLTSSVLAGISALKGPLHGGAPGPVLDMLDSIGAPGNAEAWLDDALDRGERLMGFGHRIYRVRDPRADELKRALAGMVAAGAVDAGRIALAEAVEQAALSILKRRKPNRPLDTNVEFYTAVLLEALGFPRDAFTTVFAMGRTAGWIAHAREQEETGRLIRPQSRYIGPHPLQAA
jgi:citrate synthase